MMFCKNCGKQLADGTTFCDACGAAQAAPVNQPPVQETPPPPYQQSNPYVAPSANGVPDDTTKVVSALAYLGILFFLPLVVQPVTAFGRYHANQGLILLIASVALSIVISIITAVFVFIPYLGWMISGLLWAVYGIGIPVLAILGIVNAVNKKMVPLPIIGKLFVIIK